MKSPSIGLFKISQSILIINGTRGICFAGSISFQPLMGVFKLDRKIGPDSASALPCKTYVSERYYGTIKPMLSLLIEDKRLFFSQRLSQAFFSALRIIICLTSIMCSFKAFRAAAKSLSINARWTAR